ncbi:serine hydrolase domain-containing protein [Streptomyces swartbergensis]|uniref:serine hydrolase domain-containing protein n=1 Tax=Streptomyces swartbergensis TaxID=487165 RepID=UPI0037F3B839
MLQKVLQEIVDSGFTGVQLRVHDEMGEWVGSAGVGRLGESAEPPTDGHCRIGSNTKTFIATLVLQLVAEGRIGLDTPADDYLSAFGLDRRITVRMLLQHTQQEVPEPHAHAYYRYEEEDGRQTTVDVTRQNPSWISGGGDMISTTRDLHTFISALMRGKLVPAPLLAEMRKPHPKAGYGLGVFVQETERGGTIITHNGGITGHAALMYNTPDGSKTLTAALNYVDDAAMSLAEPFQKATQMLVREVFC